jgi:hypothetical protein
VERIKLEKPLVFTTARADGPVYMLEKDHRQTSYLPSVVFRNATMFVSKGINEMLIGTDILDKAGFQIRRTPYKELEHSERNGSEFWRQWRAILTRSRLARRGNFTSAAYGESERYDGDLANGAEAEGFCRVKPVRLPDLPPMHGNDPLDAEKSKSTWTQKLLVSRIAT